MWRVRVCVCLCRHTLFERGRVQEGMLCVCVVNIRPWNDTLGLHSIVLLSEYRRMWRVCVRVPRLC